MTRGATFTYNLRFPGQYYDAETGLHYNYFRDYDPSIGRYIQSDPIGLDGGLNTYLYANANSLTFFDEDGRSPSIILRGGPAAMAWCMKSPRCKKQLEEWQNKFKDFCDDFRCELRRDNKPHPFVGLGNCEHYQLTCWVDKKKQSDMHVYWPIPGTCRGGPGPSKPASE